jgi:hypothetical protein
MSWTVSAGAPLCTTIAHRSGLSALQIPGDSNLHQLSQKITVHAGQTYDVSGWLKILSQTSSFSLQIQILALNASDMVISTFDVGSYTGPTSDWERFGLSTTMPAGTTKARLQIIAQGLGAPAYLDGLDFQPAQQPPLSPLPMFYSEGDVVPTQQPMLRWSDVTGATSFRLQVTSDRAFNSLVADVTTPSPFYPLEDDLAYNRRYFWRVKAVNGAGQSAWSPAWSFIPRPADHYYNDEFETGSLSPVWSWVREAPGNWGFSGPPWGTRSNGYLYLNVLVGGLHSRHDAKNLLLQPLPAGDFEASTFFLTPGLGSNKRQAGLLIYQDDDNYLKLVYIYEDGYKIKLQGVVSQTVVAEANIPRLEALPIKIARRGNTYSGYYSTDDVTWQSLGQPLTVTWPTARMGLVAFDPQHDPIDDDPNQQARMFFDWFRVRPGCTRVITDVYPLASGTVAESAGDCNEGLGHSAGFTITLAANPNPGYQFLSWSGAITGTTNPISLTISHDITVTANFSQTLQTKRIFLPIIYH